MKSQNEKQKLTEAETQSKKPRFKIEKLEERIAPHHSRSHYYHGRGYNNGSGGHCGHGACK